MYCPADSTVKHVFTPTPETMLKERANRRTTLADVARRAGVSRTTASFVLNGRDEMRISDAASERVRRAARELDYRPNLAARSLTSQLSRTMAMLSDRVTLDGYAGQIVAGSLASAIAAEHMLFIGETGGDKALESQLILDFASRQVDGFIYAAAYSKTIELPPLLADQRVVLVNCMRVGMPIPTLIPDDLAAGRSAGEYLLAKGHSSGIYLVGETPQTSVAARDRRQGITDSLALESVALAGQVDSKWWPESSYEEVGKLLAEGHRPSVLICLNDRAALGAYQALAAASLPVPEAVSVLSFDDSPLAAWLNPGLSSFAIPHYEMGARAIDLLLQRTAPEVHRLPMPLRERESVASVG
jgi:LacI family transcriptional regulator